MTRKYTKDELISELQRFHRENGRVPKIKDIQTKFGYPDFNNYRNHFGSWNNALKAAGLKINKIQSSLDRTETCLYCGKRADEIPGFVHWVYPNGKRFCHQHGQNSDYVTKNLDPKSTNGKAFVSQRIVANVLSLELKDDCNCSISHTYPYDLYNKNRYNYINVKDSKLHHRQNQSTYWEFNLNQKMIPDTYVMLGYDKDRKNILRVWITDAIDDLVFNDKIGKLLKWKTISNSYESLKEAEPWEVDPKPYDDMLRLMSRKRKETNGKECVLDSCNLNRSN